MERRLGALALALVLAPCRGQSSDDGDDAVLVLPTHGNPEQLLTGNFYTIRSYTDHGCLELCNANVSDCSAPYMQASTLSQVWVNPVCTGAPGQLWRTVPGAGGAPGGGVFLVSRQQGFCLNRCEGGGCGYRGNAVGLATCLQGSGDQAFAFNGSQIEFSGAGECLTACRPGSQEDGCANGGSNMITPRNAEALACGGLRSQQWYIQ